MDEKTLTLKSLKKEMDKKITNLTSEIEKLKAEIEIIKKVLTK